MIRIALLLVVAVAGWADTLTGAWTVTEVDGKPVMLKAPPVIEFQLGGKTAGMAGCNSFSGTFEQHDEALKFGPAILTRKACLGDGMAAEQAFTKAMDVTASYKMEDKKMLLLDSDGTVLAVLQQN